MPFINRQILRAKVTIHLHNKLILCRRTPQQGERVLPPQMVDLGILSDAYLHFWCSQSVLECWG
jgi:hypothetical protein